MASLSNRLKSLNYKQWLAVLALLLMVLWGVAPDDARQVLSSLDPMPPGYYRVTNFVDGDTLEVDMAGTMERVRFIGLDTPEKNHPDKPVQCFAEAASQHLKQLIGSQPVSLAADPVNQNRDRYDRLLRYVYLPDGTLLNARQIADGYGFAYLSFPFEKIDEFKGLEDQARTRGLGLWGSCSIERDGGFISTSPAA